VTKKTMAKLKKLPNTWWLRSHMAKKAGVPDYIGCVAGQFVAIEFKRGSINTPSPLQQYTIANMQHAGAKCWVVNNNNWQSAVEEICSLLSGRS